MAVYESPGAGRVLLATTGGPLTAEPTWTRYDNLATCRCFGFDWQRGRQSEFDVTNTGTARVYFHDRAGTLNTEAIVGDQIMLQLYDPVASLWQPVFRGHINDAPSVPNPSAEFSTVTLECVDIFDYLAGVKMVPGEFGDVLPVGMSGVVFYEDGPVGSGDVSTGRIQKLLDDAGLAASMYVEFSGNVHVNETLYDADDDILSALRDAADAEFPSGIAQVYVDRFGRVVFHGRFARFDPDTVSGDAGDAAWDFRRWEAATRDDVGTTRAQIREFAYNRPRTRIVNSYLAWPRKDENGREIKQSVVETLVRTDPTSIAAYGYRGLEDAALIIKQHKNNGNTGADECGLFGDWWIANYADPRKNVERVTFKSLPPGDNRATATWAAMTRMDISDILHLWVDEAGLVDEEFYIEGISGQCRVGNPAYDFVTVTPNLSPQSYYLNNVFDAT